ncbi:phage virion morphogenesis protein [Ewingella allii]|uniref:phage virion morphogenesis protein n=1 Tax=Ewingella allii TaxID=3092550 RepID=UPI0037BAF3CB
MIRGQLDPAQVKALRKQLNALELTPQKRQRLLWRLAKYGLMPAAKRNVRNQEGPDGQKWQGRQTKRKGKMLRNMPKLLHIRDMPQIDGVRVYLSGGGYHNGKKSVAAGTVGYGQQNGMSVTVNRRQVEKKSRVESLPASVRQAKRLRTLGYKVRKGKRWRKPALKEIQESMTMAKAGLLIRVLSGKAAKASWSVDVPARPFLGISQEDFNKALARQLQGIGYGAG